MVFMTSCSLSLRTQSGTSNHSSLQEPASSPNKYSPKDTSEERCTLSSLQGDTKHVESLNTKINLEAAWLQCMPPDRPCGTKTAATLPAFIPLAASSIFRSESAEDLGTTRVVLKPVQHMAGKEHGRQAPGTRGAASCSAAPDRFHSGS